MPSLNAFLNALSFVLLLAGYGCIRRKKVLAHKICMISAFGVSLLFLTSYVVYHATHGVIHFQKQGWIRPVYFGILISHTLLAVLIVPLVLTTLSLAWRGRFEQHKRIARWTLPLWMYVSLTGVVVYWMLYRL